MKDTEERYMFNLWIISLVITFFMSLIGLVFNNLIIIFLSIILGVISSIIFISLMDKIISAIEKEKSRSYKELIEKMQLEEDNPDKDFLFRKRYITFIEKMDSAETIKELESILEELSVSKLKLNSETESVAELKKRIQSKFEKLNNES